MPLEIIRENGVKFDDDCLLEKVQFDCGRGSPVRFLGAS